MLRHAARPALTVATLVAALAAAAPAATAAPPREYTITADFVNDFPSPMVGPGTTDLVVDAQTTRRTDGSFGTVHVDGDADGAGTAASPVDGSFFGPPKPAGVFGATAAQCDPPNVFPTDTINSGQITIRQTPPATPAKPAAPAKPATPKKRPKASKPRSTGRRGSRHHSRHHGRRHRSGRSFIG